MESDRVNTEDGFFPGACDSVWYENLKRYGSCLELLDLLKEQRTRIHELGPEGITVLHKGVQHGCVALVRFILVDMFDDRGHCNCSLHGTDFPSLTREKLLRKACSYGSTAVNMAVVSGSPKMVLLLEWAIDLSNRLRFANERLVKSREDFLRHTNYFAILSDYRRQMRPEKEIQAEITSDIDNIPPVPNVKDEDINILVSSTSDVKRKVISVIEGILGDAGDNHKNVVDMVKEMCRRNADFNFVPVAHVFLHFLVSVNPSDIRESLHENGGFHEDFVKFVEEFGEFQEDFMVKVLDGCISDREYGENGSMLKTLFNILDPQGRTILHATLEGRWFCESFMGLFKSDFFPEPIRAECLNAKDGAGRTIFHLMYIHDDLISFLDWNDVEDCNFHVTLSSQQDKSLRILKEWCFPSAGTSRGYDWRPMQLAIIFNSRNCLSYWSSNGRYRLKRLNSIIRDCEFLSDEDFKYFKRCRLLRPLQLAAALGRIEFLEFILKHTKSSSTCDRGLGNVSDTELPAIHCAAYFGQVEAIHTILKFPVYDPIIQHSDCGTALHFLLNSQQYELDVGFLDTILLFHLLPNSAAYERLKKDFSKFYCNEKSVPKMYSANEVSCINLLLRAGTDILTPHCRTKELPGPGPIASDEARKWWYDKVDQEVVTVKTSVSYAANATSVVAALVATASFMGPFQPPLGYADSNGYVSTDRSPVRVFLVCNSLSFFSSIASILMVVLPAIRMPNESLYDELLRSQRYLKCAALMLLISIICILISFSSASLAVVSSEWQDRQLVVACVVCGGLICVVVLAIYVIRMLRILFHRNDWFRRKFVKYMYC